MADEDHPPQTFVFGTKLAEHGRSAQKAAEVGTQTPPSTASRAARDGGLGARPFEHSTQDVPLPRLS